MDIAVGSIYELLPTLSEPFSASLICINPRMLSFKGSFLKSPMRLGVTKFMVCCLLGVSEVEEMDGVGVEVAGGGVLLLAGFFLVSIKGFPNDIFFVFLLFAVFLSSCKSLFYSPKTTHH